MITVNALSGMSHRQVPSDDHPRVVGRASAPTAPAAGIGLPHLARSSVGPSSIRTAAARPGRPADSAGDDADRELVAGEQPLRDEVAAASSSSAPIRAAGEHGAAVPGQPAGQLRRGQRDERDRPGGGGRRRRPAPTRRAADDGPGYARPGRRARGRRRRPSPAGRAGRSRPPAAAAAPARRAPARLVPAAPVEEPVSQTLRARRVLERGPGEQVPLTPQRIA